MTAIRRPPPVAPLLIAGLGPVGLALWAGALGAQIRTTPCDDPRAEPWIVELRDRVVTFDQLARYGIDTFGAPLACTGAVTGAFDGRPYGRLELTLPGGATFSVETMPPEGSVVELRHASGFDDEAGVIEAVRASVDFVGVAIDWTTPVASTADGTRTETYRDPDPGLNASVSLLYAGDHLIAVRFSLAL